MRPGWDFPCFSMLFHAFPCFSVLFRAFCMHRAGNKRLSSASPGVMEAGAAPPAWDAEPGKGSGTGCSCGKAQESAARSPFLLQKALPCPPFHATAVTSAFPRLLLTPCPGLGGTAAPVPTRGPAPHPSPEQGTNLLQRQRGKSRRARPWGG